MSEKKVTIIVPIYNVGPFVEQCVRSIMAQTLREIEIILIDDGSPDDSGATCDRLAQEDSRIVVIHQANAGVSVARNAGIARATADYLMFVDGDDWLTPDSAETLYNIIDSDPECDMATGGYYRNRAHSERFTGWQLPIGKIFEFDLRERRREFIASNLIGGVPELERLNIVLCTPWPKIFRTEMVRANSLQFPVGQVRAQDQVFLSYALQHARKFTIVNKAVYHYRMWEGSIVRKMQNSKVRLDIFYHWCDNIRQFFCTYGYDQTMRDTLECFIANRFKQIDNNCYALLKAGKLQPAELAETIDDVIVQLGIEEIMPTLNKSPLIGRRKRLYMNYMVSKRIYRNPRAYKCLHAIYNLSMVNPFKRGKRAIDFITYKLLTPRGSEEQ